jgi:hypothetical protein
MDHVFVLADKKRSWWFFWPHIKLTCVTFANRICNCGAYGQFPVGVILGILGEVFFLCRYINHGCQFTDMNDNRAIHHPRGIETPLFPNLSSTRYICMIGQV